MAQNTPTQMVKDYVSHIQNKDFKAAYALLTLEDKKNQPFWFYGELHSYPIKNVRRFFGTIGDKAYYQNIQNILENKNIEFISIDQTNTFANATFQAGQQLINIALSKNGNQWYIDAKLKDYQSILGFSSILITRKLLENWLFYKIDQYLTIDYNERFYLFELYKKKYLDIVKQEATLYESSMKDYHNAKNLKAFFDANKFRITQTKILNEKDKQGVEISFENNSEKEIKNIFAQFIYLDEYNNVIKQGASALLPPGKTLKAKEKITHPYKFLPPKNFNGTFKLRPISILF
jgi:hypothetical protein